MSSWWEQEGSKNEPDIDLGELINMVYEGEPISLEATATTQQSGIINDPACREGGGKTMLMIEEAQHLRDMGFDIVMVGHRPNHKMLKALEDVGFKVVVQESSIKQPKQPAQQHAGPRDKWGRVK